MKLGACLALSPPGKGINVIILFYLANDKITGTLTPGDDASAAQIFTKETLPKNVAFPLHREMISRWFNKQL